MRNLERRVGRLESAVPPVEPDDEAARERFFARLQTIGQRLLDAGIPDATEMSVAERVGVALASGDPEGAGRLLREFHARNSLGGG